MNTVIIINVNVMHVTLFKYFKTIVFNSCYICHMFY